MGRAKLPQGESWDSLAYKCVILISASVLTRLSPFVSVAKFPFPRDTSHWNRTHKTQYDFTLTQYIHKHYSK